jgi:Flp pilus assembly protein TadD
MKQLIRVVVVVPAMLACGFSQSKPGSTPAAIAAHMQRANSALRANDTEIAAREFHAVLELDPKNPEAHTNLGVLAFQRGDCAIASDEFRQALAVRPSLPQAEALLGMCERRSGKADAQKLLESAFAKLHDPGLQTLVGAELVGTYYASGNVEKAVNTTQKLVDLNPEDPDILYTAQRLYNELADETLNKLAIVAPNSARMQQVIAERLINGGDLDVAMIYYRKALELDPNLRGIRYELAEATLEKSRLDPQNQQAAKAQIEEAQRLEGDSANLECELARIAVLQDDLAQANAHYTTAFKLDPGNTEAQLGLGRVLTMMDKPQEARKYLLLAVGSDPLNHTAHYRLAMVDRKLGLEDEAKKEAKLAQEIKATKDNVERLYVQMHKQRKPEQDDPEVKNSSDPSSN